jgi:magnesium-transporting ATPase (P-type)
MKKNFAFLTIFLLIYFLVVNHISNLETQKVQALILKTETFFYIFTFILLISLLFVFHKEFSSSLKNIKKVWWLVLSIFILSLIIRETLPPKTARLFFDEDIYLDMAKQIATHASSCLCDYGNKFECFRCELMKWPVGHPFLLSIPIFLFGLNYSVISHFMIFLSSLSVVFVFL